MREGLVLASTSPRRRELLAALAIPFRVVSPSVPERRLPGEAPSSMARRLALAKARAVAAVAPRATVIGADTIVVLDGQVLGKPASRAHAERMLARLQGRSHQVQTAVAVLAPPRLERVFLVRSTVTFAPMSRDEIRAYVATGEPMDKAGAYALQGVGASHVRGVRGSVTNVIGLPLWELRRCLAAIACVEPADGDQRGNTSARRARRRAQEAASAEAL